jgi:hypothetical protein
MCRICLAVVFLTCVTFAWGSFQYSDYHPFGETEELFWDNGNPGNSMTNGLRGVWFVMPFEGKVITVRTYLSGDAGYDSPFDIMITPRAGNGMPDEGNPYGVMEYAGGEATGAGWLDVDVSDLDVHLEEGAEFYYVFDPRPASGLPRLHYDNSGVSGPHNAWRTFSGSWSTSVLAPYMMRVIVEDESGTSLELNSWGYIKRIGF